MAKKRKAKHVPKSFIILHTGCGSLSQLCIAGGNDDCNDIAGDVKGFPSMAAAKEAANKYAQDSGGNVDTVIIAQILNVAKPSGVTWTGKTEL